MEVNNITHYYRPAWTCGRYNDKHKVAIFYNLIEGMSYFFENASAKVISLLLNFKRNQQFSISHLSQISGISADILSPFLQELESRGLLTHSIFSEEQICQYRNNLKPVISEKLALDYKKFLDQSTIDNSDSAERTYSDKVDEITSVMFELTYRCSAKCIHCYNPGATRNDNETCTRGNREELNITDYKRIIEELIPCGLVKVCLSGGDPFSKKEIWELLDFLYEKEIAVDIFTNGISVCNDVRRIASYYPRLIGVSLYSNKQEDHEAITKIKGSYSKTIHFIEECHAYSLPLNIKCCIMKPNIRSYYTVKDVAQKNGAIAQFDLNITDSVEGDICASQNLRLSSDMLEVVFRDPDLPYYISKIPITQSKPIDFNGLMCNAGVTSFCITPEGLLQPCCAYPLILGNLKKNSFKAILGSDKVSQLKKVKLRDSLECHRHPYCLYCQMCPGNNYIAHGTPLKPSHNNCEIAIARFNLANKMQHNYDPLEGMTLQERLNLFSSNIERLEKKYTSNYRINMG